MRRQADAWAEQYRDNQPFPHIGIDTFFDDEVIRKVAAEFPGEFESSWNRTFLDAGAYEEQKLGLDRLRNFLPTFSNSSVR